MKERKGRVRVETNRESPQTYDVGKNEEVTVRTEYEKPKVTGGGRGIGGASINPKEALSCLVVTVVLLAMAIYYIDYAIETHIIKGINPNYVTTFEKAEEEKEKAKIKKEEEKKKKEKEAEKIYAQKPENIKERMLMEIETRVVLQREYSFRAHDCCVFDNCIWGCGNLVYNQNKQNEESHPTLVYSDDNGSSYKILFCFEEKNHRTHRSNIIFLDKNKGFLSFNRGLSSSKLYKTETGGKSWQMILNTRMGQRIVNITADSNQHIIAGLSWSGCKQSIESYDCGESWSLIEDGEAFAWTHDKGLTWEIKEGRFISSF